VEGGGASGQGGHTKLHLTLRAHATESAVSPTESALRARLRIITTISCGVFIFAVHVQKKSLMR